MGKNLRTQTFNVCAKLNGATPFVRWQTFAIAMDEAVFECGIYILRTFANHLNDKYFMSCSHC